VYAKSIREIIMNKVIQISFGIKRDIEDYTSLFKFLKSFPNINPVEGIWYIVSPATAQQIKNDVTRLVYDGDDISVEPSSFDQLKKLTSAT
jgi:hypothetical protein